MCILITIDVIVGIIAALNIITIILSHLQPTGFTVIAKLDVYLARGHVKAQERMNPTWTPNKKLIYKHNVHDRRLMCGLSSLLQ